jgi:ElaB/YqjD/DUF883 family membrane-anchored ribosome-binding protein
MSKSTSDANIPDPMAHVRNAAQSAARGAREAASDLRDATHDAGAELSQGARRAADDLHNASVEAGEELQQAASAAAKSASDLWDRTGDLIRKHPVEATGIAFAAGFLLARMMRN